MVAFQRFFILILILFLTSCSFVKKTTKFDVADKKYLAAQSVPPLRMPPGTKSYGIESYYPVSEKNYSAAEKNVGVAPPGLENS